MKIYYDEKLKNISNVFFLKKPKLYDKLYQVFYLSQNIIIYKVQNYSKYNNYHL